MPKSFYTFRRSTPLDHTRIWQIILQAKAQMYREQKQQWSEQYPAPQHISDDTAKGYGHVLCNANNIIAYGAVIFDGEPAYSQINGVWLSQGQYVVVHRLAVAEEAKRQGVAPDFMLQVEKLAIAKGVHSFKVDTNFDNFHMLKILQKLGFKQCGEINYPQGKRIAFEKLIG